MLFILGYAFVAFLFFWVYGQYQQARRVRNIRQEWRRVEGEIIEFGFRWKRPEVRYRYEVDGMGYESDRLIPGIRKSGTSGSQPLEKTYLDPYGRLLYTAGRKASVYVNPEDPTDATLYPGAGFGRVSLPLFALLLLGVLIALHLAGGEFRSRHELDIAAAFFGLVAAFLCWQAVRLLWQYLRGRDYSSVEGVILEAQAERMGNKENFSLGVKYEYTVGGVCYTSRTYSSMGLSASQTEAAVKAQAEALLANPVVRVWYDPRKPWVCHLVNGPLVGGFLIFLVGVVFGAVSIVLFTK